MASHEATTAWPTNLGAYLRALPALPFTGFAATLAASSWAAEDVAAAVASGAGDLGVLLAGDHPHGWRRHAKSVMTWAGTIVGSVALAVAKVEGDPALTLGSLAQVSAHDALLIAVLVGKSTLQTVLRNAPAQYADVATDVGHVLDLVDPTTADTSGRPVTAATSGLTGTLPQLVMVDGKAVIPTQNLSVEDAVEVQA